MTATAMLAANWRDVPRESRAAAFDMQLTAWGFWVRCIKDNPAAQYDSVNILASGSGGEPPEWTFPIFDAEEELHDIYTWVNGLYPRQGAALWARFARKGGDPELLDLYNEMCFARRFGFRMDDDHDIRIVQPDSKIVTGAYKIRDLTNYYKDLEEGKRYMRNVYNRINNCRD